MRTQNDARPGSVCARRTSVEGFQAGRSGSWGMRGSDVPSRWVVSADCMSHVRRRTAACPLYPRVASTSSMVRPGRMTVTAVSTTSRGIVPRMS